jgi:hypothetical protein
METKNYATEINEANVGRLIQYHDNGWRIGTLDGFTEDSVRVKKITGGNVKFVKRDDCRLVIRETEKPKAKNVLDEIGATLNNQTSSAEQRKPKGTKKSGKPEKAAKKAAHKPAKKAKAPKSFDVKFDVARIVKLYDKGKGKSVSEIAQAIGYPKGHGNNRVANCLIREGVFKGQRTEA